MFYGDSYNIPMELFLKEYNNRELIVQKKHSRYKNNLYYEKVG